MGGRIALHIQQAYPDHVPALVGLSTAPGIKDNNERLSRLASDTSLMNELEACGFESFLNEWYDLPLFCSIHNNKPLIDSLIASRSKNDPKQLRKSLELLGNGAMPSLWEDLTEMNLPILLVTGTEDKKYENINLEMSNLMPLAEHQSIQGADHTFHLEKPLDTAHLIRHFLRQVIEGV
jgi:2-succinyl-6-hydroxy-2,4-cyclohexadiene-1-carboxylate synthase